MDIAFNERLARSIRKYCNKRLAEIGDEFQRLLAEKDSIVDLIKQIEKAYPVLLNEDFEVQVCDARNAE